MTIQQLQYVLALDQYRHFVNAAEYMHVTQPTLTMQIKKLEDELGCEIFDRKSKPLRPTPFGETIIKHARNILTEVNELKDKLHEEESAVKGDIRLGIIPTLAPYLLPLFLNKFSKQYPEVNLHIVESQSEHLVEDLLQNRLDLGLLVTPLEDKNIIEQPLFYEPFWFYGHPNHPLLEQEKIDASSIENQPFWVLGQGHCFRDQVLNICGKPSGIPRINYESGSIETVKHLVDAGESFTLIPELSIRTKKEKQLTRAFADPVPVREVSLIHNRGFSKKGIANALHDSIYENLPKSIKSVKRKQRIRWR